MNSPNAFESHPDEITVASYVEGRLPDATRVAVETHLADCNECRRALVLLRGLEELEAEAVPREFREASRTRRWMPWAAAAAAAILGALLVLPLQEAILPGSEGLPVFRDAGTQGPGLLSPAVGAVVSRDDLVFQWTPVEGADRYRVQVWSVNTDFLLEFVTAGEQTEAGWPANEPAAPADELIWRVQALSLNRTLAESRPVSFRVRD